MAFKSPPEYLLRTALRLGTRSCSSSSSTFRAAICKDLGKPLVIENMPRPPLKPHDVRISVKHASINFADVLVIAGKYQEKPPLPFVPGNEFAGIVKETGEKVQHLEPGMKVCGISTGLGAFAEETVVNSTSLVPIDDEVSTSVAASLPCVYGTASMGLKRKLDLQEGQTILITGAAGGVGLAFVDLAAHVHGATVIAACSSDDKCSVARSMGAHHTINYSRENMMERVMEITNKKGANAIVDNVGGPFFKQCLRSIAFEGKLLVIGFASGEIPKLAANIPLLKSCSIIGLYWGSYSVRNPAAFAESLTDVFGYFREGKIRPHVGAEFPLARVNEAVALIAGRKSVGKVVIGMEQ